MCYNIGMYIEFVILDNFLLTYLAGAAATRFCQNKVCVWRVAAASVCGTVVAVFYPFMHIGLWGEIAVKLALWIVLSVIMYVRSPRFVAQSLMFLGCTFMFGGASYAVGLILYGNARKAAEFSAKYPLFTVLGTASALYACIRYVVKRVRAPRARAPYEYGTYVEVFGTTMRFSAFLDTGNCVFDDKTGLPVIITDTASFAEKLYGAAAVEFAKALPSLRKITAKTHGGVAEILIVPPTKITVYSDRRGHTINAMVGLVCGSEKRFVRAHEMLLNPAAI